jgi:hypothetical protein
MEAPENREYFEKRAEQERAAAEQAADERVAQPHRELARRYADLAKGDLTMDGEPGPELMAGLAPEFRVLP